MSKNNRLSRDQKRKAKLKKRAERSNKHESLAYHGKKYKSAVYVPVMHSTETGIYEAYVISGRELTDDQVEAALGRLIIGMRQGPLPPLAGTDGVKRSDDKNDDMVTFCVRTRWHRMAEEGLLPGRDDLIGVLRTILNSLEIWRSESMHSQGYLRYIEGFMKKTGVSVRQLTEDMLPIPEPEDDPVLELGRDWDDGDQEAGGEFREAVERLIRAGQAERVIEVCQQLLGETRNSAILPQLEAFALLGHQAIRASLE